MAKANIFYSIQVLLLIFLVIAALILGKPFLVPVCFAGLFAMLFLPLCKKLERNRVPRAVAAITCVFILLFVIGFIIWLISWQINSLTSDLGNIEDKVTTIIGNIEETISEVLGISRERQREIAQQQTGETAKLITAISGSIVSAIIGFVLMIVYVFLFLYYRRHIKKFITRIIPKNESANASDAISSIERITQQYLTGMGLMIVCLWGMYIIGFSIVGLKNAYFFAILCGLFEIVPYVGNFTGNLLAAMMAITQGGGMPMVVGVLITYGIIQFLQTYFLEPLVVGVEVNINPLFTIIGLVLGELIWGIPGMVLAIPLLGIAKIICDHVPSLQPYGLLLGRERPGRPTFIKRIQEKFKF